MYRPKHVLKLLIVFYLVQSMLIHQPTDAERIVWYGGNSTQIHYEVFDGNEWKALETQTITEFPHSVKEFKQAVVDFYNYCSPIYCKES